MFPSSICPGDHQQSALSSPTTTLVRTPFPHSRWWHPLLCRRRILIFTITITILVAAATVTTWAILRHKRHPPLLDITVSALNVSVTPYKQSYLLTSTFQITLSSRNPNGNRRSILYDDLHVYTSYHGQQITQATRLPPTYQSRGGVDVWSPLVFGVSVPIAPYNALALNQEKSHGFVMMNVKIQGHVTWRPGIFTSGGFISVNCPAYITTGIDNKGVPLSTYAIKYRLMKRCSVSL